MLDKWLIYSIKNLICIGLEVSYFYKFWLLVYLLEKLLSPLNLKTRIIHEAVCFLSKCVTYFIF